MFLVRLSIIQQLSTNQHERLAVETPRGERIEIRALYSTRHREQQSVQPQLPLFQHCSIQAKMQKISCEHGYIGYTDMLPTCQFLLWCSLIPTQAPHFLTEQFLLSPKVEVTPPPPPSWLGNTLKICVSGAVENLRISIFLTFVHTVCLLHICAIHAISSICFWVSPPSQPLTILSQLWCNVYWLLLPIHVVFYHSLRLAPRCPASTL